MKGEIDIWRKFLTEHKDDINAAAGILLFNPDSEVMLSKRSETVNNPLTIGTIGGHLTQGESPLEGAKREFYEESSYDGPFDNITMLAKQTREDGFRYYSFIAFTEDYEDHDFLPFEEFENEILWNKWIPFDEAIHLGNLHPGLEQTFTNVNLIAKIREFLDANITIY